MRDEATEQIDDNGPLRTFAGIQFHGRGIIAVSQRCVHGLSNVQLTRDVSENVPSNAHLSSVDKSLSSAFFSSLLFD